MANIKSAQKRMRQTVVRQARNKSVRSRLRTAVKKHRATEGGAKPESLSATYSEIAHARKTGVNHPPPPARSNSRLAPAARKAAKAGS
jgi:small subunit ribosomal protein S20